MKDYTPTKIICRLINLLLYACMLFYIYLFYAMELYLHPTLTDIFSDYMKVIVILAVPLILLMLISLLIKYKMQNESKIKVYRIFDTILRICSTVPITIAAIWYIRPLLQATDIVKMIADVGIFIIINCVLRFTLKETLSVSFITSDSL